MKLIVTFDPTIYSNFAIPKALLVFKPDAKYSKTLGKELKRLITFQDKKTLETGEKVLREIELTMEIHYKKRSIDQNSLRWSLYEIETNEQNGGQQGPDMVTKEKLYYQDAIDFNEHVWIESTEENMLRLEKAYMILEKTDILQNEVKVGIRVHGVVRNSQLTTVETAQRIEMQFNRMSSNGIPITNSGDILKYLNDHRQFMNDEKIVLHSDEIMTKDKYKELHPLCEGCGTYVGDASGHCAHINAIGMGSDKDKELKKNFSSNWLHLCRECHMDVWHGKGEITFVKTFPHCKFKVSMATKRDYDLSRIGIVSCGEESTRPESTQEPVLVETTNTPEKIDPDAITEELEIW